MDTLVPTNTNSCSYPTWTHLFLQTQESKHKDTEVCISADRRILSAILGLSQFRHCPLLLYLFRNILRAAKIPIMKPSLSNREGCKIVRCSCPKLRVSVSGTYEQNNILVVAQTMLLFS